MKPIYSAEQIREWDQFTIVNEPISSAKLMCRAASRATKVILTSHLFNEVAVVCGPGNNGGDGLVIAQILHECQKSVHVFILKSAQYSQDFEHYLSQLDSKIKKTYLVNVDDFTLDKEDLLIDCLFGTGLSRGVSGTAAKLIDAMNNIGLPIVSIDIPSGLFSDHLETTEGAVIQATTTLSFMQYKRSFLFAKSARFVGNVKLIDIDLDHSFDADCNWKMLESADISIRPKAAFNHKGNHGKSLIIGGLDNMNGAAILASRAAMASGSGYVFCASEEATKQALLVQQPEIISLNIDQLDPKVADAIGIGTGLGVTNVALETLKRAFESKRPLVIDADAINLLAEHRELQKNIPKGSILTPHLKELQRLLEKEDQEDLIESQQKFSQQHEVYILQKGKFSKITTPEGIIIVNPTGNSAMGTAGMGDVLTGIITSFLAQGYSVEQAVCYGCYLHGKAADDLVYQHNYYTITASQIIEQLPKTIADHLA